MIRKMQRHEEIEREKIEVMHKREKEFEKKRRHIQKGMKEREIDELRNVDNKLKTIEYKLESR
jgi:hypothetical protein